MKINTRAFLLASIFPLLIAAPLLAHADDVGDGACPKHLKHREAGVVLNAHLAAFQAGDAKLVACDYADDAILILPGLLPGGVAEGRANIEAFYASVFAQAGQPITVTIQAATIAGGFALLEYQVSSAHIVIEEGIDTFAIEDGFIAGHTAHLAGISFLP